MPKEWRGKGRRGRPTLRWRIALRDLERVGDKWRKRTTDRRLLIENIEKSEREKKDNGKGNRGQLTVDDSDARKEHQQVQFDPSLVNGQLLF